MGVCAKFHPLSERGVNLLDPHGGKAGGEHMGLKCPKRAAAPNGPGRPTFSTLLASGQSEAECVAASSAHLGYPPTIYQVFLFRSK